MEKVMKANDVLTAAEADIYSRWLQIMNQTGVPYVVGGAFALFAYTGIWRNTKDLDIFLKPTDLKSVLDFMMEAGYDCEVTDPEWLAKVRRGPSYMDLIFAWNSRESPVGDTLLSESRPVRLLETSINVMAPEALIASKAPIAQRDRFDGADIVRLIYSVKGNLDWQRLLEHLEGHFELLLWHLIFFSYIYPGHAAYIPKSLIADLFKQLQKRWRDEAPTDDFRGILLDPVIFGSDCTRWGLKRPPKRKPLVNWKGEVL
jgi:Nucleotidyl transferase of unknown function (DUF2204)